MSMKKTTLAAAVISACGLGLSINAHAGAYAYSFNDISNLTTTFTCSVSGLNCPNSFNFLSYQSSSGSDANVIPLPAGGTSDSQTATGTVVGGVFTGFVNPSGPGAPDAPVSHESPDGVAPKAANNFSAIGRVLPLPGGGNDYARADAQIVSEQVRGDPSSRAINVAEGLLTDSAGATANGNNTSTTNFAIGFAVTEIWSVAIDFDARPFIETFIQAGGSATGDLDASFTINRINANGSSTPVASFAPDGNANATELGIFSEIDEADLNIEISDPIADGVSAIYNPVCSGGVCDYTAVTDPFAAGNYNLIFTMHEGIVLSKVAVVPEPGTLMLIGFGLLGLPFVRRGARKAQA